MVSTLTNVSHKLSILTELRYFFVKMLRFYETVLKDAVSNAATPGIFFTFIDNSANFFLSKSEDILIQVPQKVLFHLSKYDTVWRMSLAHKNLQNVNNIKDLFE